MGTLPPVKPVTFIREIVELTLRPKAVSEAVSQARRKLPQPRSNFELPLVDNPPRRLLLIDRFSTDLSECKSMPRPAPTTAR